MIANKVLKIGLLFLGIMYIVLESFALEIEGEAVGAITLILLTYLYFKWTEYKNSLFLLFLIGFSLAHVFGFFAYYSSQTAGGEIESLYYISNIIYILSYVFLIIRLLLSLDLKTVFLQLPIPILVLVILDIFCVSIVTSTTETVLSLNQYVLEYTYNAIIMMLLSVALINYMYRNDNKSMLLLIGSICIVFSEIIQLAYYYIIENTDLSFIHSLFLVVAFLLFYIQSQLAFTGPDPIYPDEQLEV